MVDSPPMVLAFCRRNPLLRPICPRRIPTSGPGGVAGGRQTYYCGTADRHETVRQTVDLFPTARCTFAQWSYTVAAPLLVHVDEAAGRAGALDARFARPRGAHRVTDTLLRSNRRRSVSLGWVRWYGLDGQLVLAPPYPLAGEWGGHLILYVPPGHEHPAYAVSIHAWTAGERPAQGPALPHVIATLKAVVGSTDLAASPSAERH